MAAIAALLHDAIEDGGAAYAQRTREQFGDRVAGIVEGCTGGMPDASGQKEDWKLREERYIAHLYNASADAPLVSGRTSVHNARAIVTDLGRIGDRLFDRFTASKAQTLWYYEALADVFAGREAPMAGASREAVEWMKESAAP